MGPARHTNPKQPCTAAFSHTTCRCNAAPRAQPPHPRHTAIGTREQGQSTPRAHTLQRHLQPEQRTQQRPRDTNTHTHTTQAARRTANGFAALSSEGENDVESPKGLAMTTYQSKSPVTGANNGVEPRAKQQHLPALLFAAGGIWGCKGQAAIVGDDTL